ncbi:hypothetical protein HG531_005581 [Fusarium graminearum]|nr:hypothetical protein HG531_005581 [Fusarium graminearum]
MDIYIFVYKKLIPTPTCSPLVAASPFLRARAYTSGNTWNTVENLTNGIHQALSDIRSSQLCCGTTAGGLLRVLEGDQTTTVGKELESQTRVGTLIRYREEHVDTASSEDIASNGIETVVRTEATKLEASDVCWASKLEAIVDTSGAKLAAKLITEGERRKHA